MTPQPAKSLAVKQVPPDQVKLKGLQAQRFAQLANVPLEHVEGYTIAELSEKLKWVVDPIVFQFRSVCGQVVRLDPASGTYLPCPNCTVHVMDTDCDFLFYSPFDYPWLWCYPIVCHQEELLTTVTDECGNFCVLIPRFDIDWVVRWRAERYCFLETLQPPSLGDLLKHLPIIAEQQPPHIGPDPGPVEIRQSGISLEQLATFTGRETAKKILSSGMSTTFGAKNTVAQALMNQPAFHHPVPPPASAALLELHKQHQKRGSAAVAEFVQSTAKRDYNFDINRYIGPFPRWNCIWMLEKELVPVYEVPDISFWVQQDVYATGNLETIYQDGYFHVGWQGESLDNVTLHAAPNARVGCYDPPALGGCKEAGILFAGLMPNDTAYIDSDGCSSRVNPPHADGATETGATRASVFPPAPQPDTPAKAPFTGTIQLYGCIPKLSTLIEKQPTPKKAQSDPAYYRLNFKYKATEASASFTDPVVFKGVTWYLDPWPGPGTPLHVVPDADGWYPILSNPDAWFPPHELLDWPTTSYPDGLYEVALELGDANGNIIKTDSKTILLQIDNSANSPQIVSLAWRVAGTTIWNYFPNFTCMMVHRTPGTDLEFLVEYMVSMPHLLKMTLTATGCGAGTPQEVVPQPNWSGPQNWSDPPSTADPYRHWHTSSIDNTISRAAIFVLPGAALPGCYTFTLDAYSRAFNPAGGDPSDPQAHDWYIDAGSLNWNQANLSVAVVDL